MSVNLITNGSFEEGNPPTDWIDLDLATLERSSVQKYSGSYSMHIITGETDPALVAQVITVVPNKKYRFRYRIYVVAGSVGHGGAFGIGIDEERTEEWIQEELRGSVSGTGMLVGFGNTGGVGETSNEIYVDDAELTGIVSPGFLLRRRCRR